MTIALDSWLGVSVAPTTHAIAVARSKTSTKPEPVSARFVRSLIHPVRKASVSTVRFSADGARLFVAGYPSGVLQFWDVASGKELRRIESPPGYRGTAEYAELTADWSTVYVPREKRSVVRFEKDGQQDFRIDHDGSVLVYDVATGQPRPPLIPTPGRAVLAAYASPDGRTLVAVERPSYQRTEQPKDAAVLWDTRTAAAKPLGEGYAMVAFTPDSQRFILCLSNFHSQPPSGVLKLFDAGGVELAELATAKEASFTWPKVSPDGKLLAVQQSKGRINQPAVLRVWDLQTRKEIATFQSGGDSPFGMPAFSPDSKQLAATDYNGGVRVWDIATGRAILEKSFGGELRLSNVAFAPDGRRLAVGGQPKGDDKDRDPDPEDLPQPRVFLFDLAAPAAEPEVVICPHGYTWGLAISPDGKTLAVGGAGAVHLFNLAK